MKTTLISYVVILLAWTLGCKKSPVGETVDPNPPQPPANCRIVKTTYKSLTSGREAKLIKEPEIIKLDDGQKVQVSTSMGTTYQYDTKGRITGMRDELLGGNYRVFKYTYTPTILLINVESLSFRVSNKPYNEVDTLQLNEQGTLSRYTGTGMGESYLLYNADKQLLGDSYNRGQSHIYGNGNLTKLFLNAYWGEYNGQFGPTNYWLKQFSYNLTRPNIPVIYQYNGQPSRNLPIKEVWEMQGSSEFADGLVYQKIYTYTYDKLGRVKRMVVHGKSLNQGWLIEDDTDGIGVTDYEYECP